MIGLSEIIILIVSAVVIWFVVKKIIDFFDKRLK